MIRCLIGFSLAFILQAGLSQEQQVPILNFEGIKPYLDRDSDTIYLINFWATWCKPCVAELPLFEKLGQDKLNHPIRIVLVSLDFKNQVESKLIPFIKKHDLKSQVVVLDDPDANYWIDQVDQRWSGALPATIVYKGPERLFFAEGFEDYEALKTAIGRF